MDSRAVGSLLCPMIGVISSCALARAGERLHAGPRLRARGLHERVSRRARNTLFPTRQPHEYQRTAGTSVALDAQSCRPILSCPILLCTALRPPPALGLRGPLVLTVPTVPIRHTDTTTTAASRYYRAGSYCVSKLLTDLPISGLGAMAWAAILYFAVGLRASAEAFFFFFLCSWTNAFLRRPPQISKDPLQIRYSRILRASTSSSATLSPPSLSRPWSVSLAVFPTAA